MRDSLCVLASPTALSTAQNHARLACPPQHQCVHQGNNLPYVARISSCPLRNSELMMQLDALNTFAVLTAHVIAARLLCKPMQICSLNCRRAITLGSNSSKVNVGQGFYKDTKQTCCKSTLKQGTNTAVTLEPSCTVDKYRSQRNTEPDVIIYFSIYFNQIYQL